MWKLLILKFEHFSRTPLKEKIVAFNSFHGFTKLSEKQITVLYFYGAKNECTFHFILGLGQPFTAFFLPIN